MARAMDVADYIIEYANGMGHEGDPKSGISNLQLQKVMYFLNVIYMLENNDKSYNGKSLINEDDYFEKWIFGPVNSSVYHEYSKNGGLMITKPSVHVQWNVDNMDTPIKQENSESESLDEKDKEFIRKYTNELMKTPGYQLVGYSHMEDQWKSKNYNIYSNSYSFNFYKTKKDCLSVIWLNNVINTVQDKTIVEGGTTMVRAMDVADYIIKVTAEHGKPVSNMQLQKIMYFLNAKYMVDKGSSDYPLITDAQFSRWDCGPVQENVYFEYRQYGASKLKRPKAHIYIVKNENGHKYSTEIFNSHNFEEDNSDVANFIKKELPNFEKADVFDLVYLSHKEPQWKNSGYNAIYSNEKTFEYYKEHAEIWSELSSEEHCRG